MMYLWASYEKYASFKSMKKGVGSGVGSGSIIQSYGSVSGSAPICHGSPKLEVRDVYLGGGNHELSIPGCDEIGLVSHQDQRLSSRLLCLA
jgi:hypothetical protein